MTFNDILKSSFLEKVSSFSPLDMVIGLGLAFIIGLFIFAIYKKTFNGVMYSSGFGISLIAMTMITTLIILAISSNAILSLGMVGALSIVRFRTAVKDPMDISYLFWAISAGIVIGAGMIPLAVFGSAFIGLVLYVFSSRKSTAQPYILVVNCDDDQSEQQVIGLVSSAVKKYLLKSKTVSSKGVELTVEVRLKDATSEFINRIAAEPGVSNAVLVSYNGEYIG